MKQIIVIRSIFQPVRSCLWLLGVPLVIGCGALAGVIYFFSQVAK